jgi:hypothetical protein
MYRKITLRFMSEHLTFLAIFILVSISVVGIVKVGFELTVETDQPQYYPGEQVNITGRLTENGSGVPDAYVCVTVTDPNGTDVLGVCMPTDDSGYYRASLILELDALLGTYDVFVEEYDHQLTASTTFEVVSPIVEAEANGPYEGKVDEVITFYGDATGGKTPYSWLWDFGDGNTSTNRNASHVYGDTGNYMVILTVTDHGGHQDNDTAPVTVTTSENQPPDKPSIALFFHFFERLMERFPLLEQILVLLN